MKIGEFVDKYCQDIVKKSLEIQSVFNDDGLPYDDIVEDESGSPMKVVYSANRQIPVRDILELDRTEFAKVYKGVDDLETYDRYCDSIILLEGEEALTEIRNNVRKEMDRIRSFADSSLGKSISSRMDD